MMLSKYEILIVRVNLPKSPKKENLWKKENLLDRRGANLKRLISQQNI